MHHLQLADGPDSTGIHSRALVFQLSSAHFVEVDVLPVEVAALRPLGLVVGRIGRSPKYTWLFSIPLLLARPLFLFGSFLCSISLTTACMAFILKVIFIGSCLAGSLSALRPWDQSIGPRKRKGRHNGQGPNMRVACATDQCRGAKGRYSVARDIGSICSVQGT